ncbi:MAG: pimeloyl-ACP methyl ester carboxylesterase [Myxococcota bacterium]|jgi:pimeloyl-ACP methyl ester carboxylesterase
MRTVIWRRQRLAIRVVGSGPPVVLVHNAGADHTLWLPVAERLADRYTVVLPDLPGFGASDHPRLRYGLDDFADAVEAVADAFGPRVAVGGSCVGGAAAWRHAMRRPTAVAALALVHPATWQTVSGGQVGWLHAVLGDRPAARAMTLATLERAWRVPAVRMAVIRRLTVAPLSEMAQSQVDAALTRPHTLRVLAELLSELRTFAVLDGFVRGPDFPPVLLAWGARNPVVPIQGISAIARALRPKAVVELPESGHLCPLEAPERLASSFRRVLDRAVWR